MTQFFSALSSTPRASRWLAGSRSARILHVFERACNLINERREILSIVAREIGNGPFNLVVENSPALTHHIHARSPVTIAPTEVQIGDIRIHINGAELWDPRPVWAVLHTARDAIVAQLAQLPTSQTSSVPFSNSLATALVTADTSLALAAAKKLAGRGQGLTPTGDDYMMGALHAAWIIHPPDVAAQIAGEIATVAAPRTTSLSGAWLKAAANGEAGILWHKLLESLIAGERSVMERQVAQLLSVGATSGADAWAGFIDTIISYALREQKYVVSS